MPHIKSLTNSVACCFAIILLSLATSAHSQTIVPLLPRPISSADLTRYADLLQLSAAQRQAVEAAHDEYKSQCRQLRRNANQRTITAWEPVADIPFSQPAMSEVSAFIAAHDSGLTGIASLDDQLFAGIERILSPDQKVNLLKVTRTRQRERLVSNFFVREWFDEPLSYADLRELFVRMDLPADHQAAAAEIMEAHETRFVTLLQKLLIASRDMRREWADSLEKAVQANPQIEKPELEQELFNTMVEAWMQATGKVQPISSELALLNRKTFMAIAALLPADQAVLKRREFYRRHYARYEAESAETFAQAALGSKELTAEQREAVSAAMNEYWEANDPLLDQLMDVVDQQRAEAMPNLEFGPRLNELHKQYQELAAQRHRSAQQARAKMSDAIGADFAKEVGERAQSLTTSQAKMQAGDQEESARVPEFEEFLPPAISEADVDGYARFLQLDDQQTESMRLAYRAYADEFKAARDNIVARQRKLRIAFAVRTPSDDALPIATFAPVEDVEQFNELTRQGLRQLNALDGGLMEQIKAILTPHQQFEWWRIEFARDCQRLLRGTRKGEAGLRTYEAYVNPVEALMHADLAQERLDQAFAILKDHEQELRGAAMSHFEAAHRAHELEDLALAHRSGGKRSEADVIAQADSERDDADALAMQARAISIGAIQLAFDELYDALPEHAAQLRAFYERLAFPRVSNDKTSAQAAIAAAVKLNDATAQQRAQLEEIAAAYSPAYREVCEQMMQVCRDWDSHARHDESATRKRMTAKYMWEELAFERDELNIAAANRLRRVLRADQLAAISVR